jgi:hypothetical protein
MFAMTDVMPRPKATALGTKDQIKDWTGSIPNLDDIYSLKSDEQLENIINAWLNGDNEEAEADSPKSREQVKTQAPTSKTRGPTNKSYGTNIDDAFADLDKDLGF